MKNVVIFFKDEKSDYINEKAFDGKSAEEMSFAWAKNFSEEVFTVKSSKCHEIGDLFSKMLDMAKGVDASTIIFSYSDCPFINVELTRKLLETHCKYKSEYTFSDGYPNGFSPEIIDTGTCGILCELAKKTYIEEGKKAISRDGIFSFIKNDINSFDIQTIISDEDWRLYRFNFCTDKKENFLACKELYPSFATCKNVEELCTKAAKNQNILKTVPSFYEIQICDKSSGSCIYSPYEDSYRNKYKKEATSSNEMMKFDDFATLIDKISDFSNKAVIGFSLWGEPLFHKDIIKFIEKVLSYDKMSVFIETDGILITDDFIEKIDVLYRERNNQLSLWSRIMISIKIDCFTDVKYRILHPECNCSIKTLMENVAKLNKVIGNNVYPQFVRMNENEDELENFFRFWKEKESPSKGQFIIQKYDNYSGFLPNRKPADLSPLERNVCWKLRRELSILTNGDVVFCREHVLDNCIGNVFTEELSNIWKRKNKCLCEQIEGKYTGKCKDCDEYYTFNF